MKKKRKLGRKLLSFLLTLALVLGLVPWISLTAEAADTSIEKDILTVNGTDMSTLTLSDTGYVLTGDTGTATLSGNSGAGYTLTLDGFTCNDGGITNQIDGLTVIIEGTNTIGTSILSFGSLNIEGSGTLEIEGGTGVTAIHSLGDLTISDSVNITIKESGTGISCNGLNSKLTLESTGEINVKGSIYGLFSNGEIDITNGYVTAEGGITGIGLNGYGAPLLIGPNAKLIAIGGEKGAIYYDTDSDHRTVQNDIAGMAWTDKEGTTGGQNIAVSTEGKPISNEYKKVEFPVSQPKIIKMNDSNQLQKDGADWNVEHDTKIDGTEQKLTLPAGNYRLDSDIYTGGSILVQDGDVSIDLNGHGIIASSGFEVFTVKNHKLTITDSKPLEVHGYKIESPQNINGAGLASVHSEKKAGDTEFTGGFITGGKNTSAGGTWGGAINVKNDGTEMFGSLEVRGCTLIGNNASCGGAVNAMTKGTVSLTGTKIIGNTSNEHGGGVYNQGSSGTVTLENCIIKNNYAGKNGGGGVRIYQGSVTIDGGQIVNNACAEGALGGGVGLTNEGSGSSVVLKGDVNISGNKTGNSVSELYLAGNNTFVKVEGELTGSTPIGVNMESARVFTNSNNTDYNIASKFKSEKTGYEVYKNDSGQLELAAHTHSYSSYSADGDTITATCTADHCSLPDQKATLTIGAPTLTVYGGSGSAEATITDNNGIQGTAVVKYYKTNAEGNERDGEALTGAPAGAGTYWAEITLGTGVGAATAHVVYTIGKAKETAPASDTTPLNISYPAETITANEGYEVAADDSGTAITDFHSILDGTTPTVYIRKKAADNNHTPSDWVAVTLTARPAAPGGLTTENSTGVDTQDGKIKGVSTDMEYSSDGGQNWTPITGDPVTVIPGTYLVRVKATETAPHGVPATLTVGSRVIVIADAQKPTAKTGLVANGSGQELVNAPSGSLPGGATEIQYVIGTDANNPPTDGYSASIPTGTEAKTYYVWYRFKADNNHTDSAPACITVTISAQNSGGGSSTPSTPSTPSTEKYTVPVENESTVQVETTISDGTAKIGDITAEDIEKVTAKDGDSPDTTQNTTIEINVSGAKQKVDSVQLTKDTVDRLADTAADSGNGVDTVTIRLTNAMVELDAATLQAVSEEAEGKDIRLVVDDTYKKSSLNTAQRKAIQSYEDVSTFEAYFESNGSRIHDFKGGTARVSVKYDLPSGQLARFVHMLYLNPTGAVERFVTTCADGWVTGFLNHFSEYAIVYDTAESNATGEAEDKEKEPEPDPEPDPETDPEPDPVETVIMYRIYNPNSGEHFYTADEEERDNVVEAGWNYEGIGWIAPISSDTPVYRLYNANVGDHLYTTSIRERDNLIKVGWRDEGIGWYSDDQKTVPLYRQYNPNAITGTHNYTAYKEENDWLVGLGWRAEDIGWYGVLRMPAP